MATRATRHGGQGPAKRHDAASALALTACLGASLCATTRAPSRWGEADRLLPLMAEPGTPTSAAWADLAALLPLGDLAQRADLLALMFVVATAVTATWTAHVLFRGRARWLAAVTSGALTCVALLHWLHATDFAHALPALPSALFATLGTTALVRSLVALGRVTSRAAAHAVAAASVVALLDPPWGVPLVGVLAIISWLRSPPGRARATKIAMGIALAPATIATVVLAWSGPTGVTWPLVSSLRVGLPPLELLERHLPIATFYPALALIILLVMPLRWRGGLLLVVLVTAALVLQVGHHPLAPVPALLVLLSIAAAGWVWLAGTVWSNRPRLDVLQAVCAAAILAALTAVRVQEIGLRSAPVATERSTASLARLYDQALADPGVVMLVHDPWLYRLLQDRRTMECWRPDILLADALAIDDADLLGASTTWLVGGRAVLSDSFDAAGRWPAQWVAEAGPLFRYVGPEVRPDDEDETGTWRRPAPGAQPSLAERWRITRLSLERARFHRATGDPQSALEALELMPTRQQALETRMQLARSLRPHAGTESELPAANDDPSWLRVGWPDAWSSSSWAEGTWVEAALAAEAGDLLYAQGEQERAVELLAEAAAEGYRPAWGALARWQLRAGEDAAAHVTLRAMADDAALRGELLEVIEWLLARDRTVDAQAILAATPDPSPRPLDELTTRLLVLRALAEPNPSTMARTDAAEDGDTLTRR